jgi:hypothetical protein
MKKWLSLCLLLLSLTACGTTHQLGVSDKFGEKSPDSVLIIGLANRPYNGHHHGLFWQSIDPATGMFDGKNGDATFVSKLSSWQGEDVVYFIHRLPPGTYAIDRMFGGYAQVGYTTMMYDLRFRPSTMAVTVEPGEIVYAGDFIIAAWGESTGFFKPLKFKRTFKHADGDIEAVQEKLKAYSGVSGDVVRRKPEKIVLKLPEQQ